ncbi:uncharacterized protein LOC129984624 [Argiope bruennichi]|uniref:uncharacterized protein LOC129984624 n=1 Tax=Argiope bruennichi TaxID=94029 RepID=UPI002494FB10|nr:uncharacterized protein LOC129984624 [Argiope bruennichi]
MNISDEDTGLGRCIADGDPLALCENRNCIIIPNDNFATLFRKGRKMSPSNYLRAGDIVSENETLSNISNQTDENVGPELSDEDSSPFFPIELTYPRMIHGEEAPQLVKRSSGNDPDTFIPPPEFAEEEFEVKTSDRYGESDHDLRGKKYEKKDVGSFRPPSDHAVRDEKYAWKDHGSFRLPSGPEFGDRKYNRKGPGSFRPSSDPEFGDKNYGRKDSDSFRSLSDPDFRDDRKNSNSFRHPSDPDFGDIKHGKDLEDSPDSDSSFLSDNNDTPSKTFEQEEHNSPHLDEHPSFRGQSESRDPTYWGGNYGYACRVPQLRNSEVTCWKWPNWQSCKQTCIYGHGITSPRGTLRSTTYTCRNTENQWKPHRMEDCQPYLNCKVRLRSPGDLKCVEPTNRPAYCDISCEEYDNHSAQRVRVTCDEKQGGMRLPFCATLDNSFMNHIRSPSS